MKIAMRDGRVFQGTAMQIVQAMQDIAFGVEQMSLDQYIDWVVENARRFEAVELVAKGRDDGRAREGARRGDGREGTRTAVAQRRSPPRAGVVVMIPMA